MASTENNQQAAPQFNNTFSGGEGIQIPTTERERRASSNAETAEWDASKTPPSRFQKRKGSIYATPSSRDGHVERNRDAVEGFHQAHSKRWSFSRKKDGATSATPGEPPRKSSHASQGSN